jgi:hypothetical protein
MALRNNQRRCADAVVKAFNSGKEEFLIAAVPRFGKTFTAYTALREWAADRDQLILVVSTMNVRDAWKEDAEKLGFKDAFVDKPVNDIDFSTLESTGFHILYCSTQKLANGSEESENLIKYFNNHSGVRTIVYDECHMGSGTERTTSVLERLDYTNRLYLSGTPYRKHLKKEFGFDTYEGDNKTFLYSMLDEREDYERDPVSFGGSVPVKLEMHVLSYINADEDGSDELSVSSAFFKKLFSDSGKDSTGVPYSVRAKEFFDEILKFCNQYNVRSILSFVPLRAVGNDFIEKIYNKKKYKAFFDKYFTFFNLCGIQNSDLDVDMTESEAKQLNDFYADGDPRIHMAFTCNKCGTGVTIEHLDATAFLKDTIQAIPFLQKSSRARTPEPGKTTAYVICFNQWQGLKAFQDSAKEMVRTFADDTPDDKEAVERVLGSGAMSLILDGKTVDYNDIADILGTYRPGQYPLFEEFDFNAWPEGTFAFIDSFFAVKSAIMSSLGKKLRNDPDLINAETPEEFAARLREKGKTTEADEVDATMITPQQRADLLEQIFVGIIQSFHDWGRTLEEVMDVESYDSDMILSITMDLGTMNVWEAILRQYPRYPSMIYNYINKK